MLVGVKIQTEKSHALKKKPWSQLPGLWSYRDDKTPVKVTGRGNE